MAHITYSTNYMGPIDTDWIAQHGSDWAAGRIDVSGTDNPWGDEIGLPPMKISDWRAFGDWLVTLVTDDMYDLDQLVALYEQTHDKITWFSKS
jgi:hypothetical protein